MFKRWYHSPPAATNGVPVSFGNIAIAPMSFCAEILTIFNSINPVAQKVQLLPPPIVLAMWFTLSQIDRVSLAFNLSLPVSWNFTTSRSYFHAPSRIIKCPVSISSSFRWTSFSSPELDKALKNYYFANAQPVQTDSSCLPIVKLPPVLPAYKGSRWHLLGPVSLNNNQPELCTGHPSTCCSWSGL